jgi:hypothetical protein
MLRLKSGRVVYQTMLLSYREGSNPQPDGPGRDEDATINNYRTRFGKPDRFVRCQLSPEIDEEFLAGVFRLVLFASAFFASVFQFSRAFSSRGQSRASHEVYGNDPFYIDT